MLKNLSPFSRLTLEIYKLSEEAPASEFQRATLDKLSQYLPFDSGMWGTGLVQDAGVKIITLHLHNSSMEMINAYQDVKNEDLSVVELAQHQSKTIGFNASTLFKDQKNILKFVEKFHHRNIFISCRNDFETRFTEWISLYRSDNEKFCTLDEIKFFDNLAPHLMQALALNRKLHLESIMEGESKKRWSLGITDHEGYIYHYNDQFQQLLASEFGVQNINQIPTKVTDSLKEKLSYRGNKIFISGKIEGDLLYLKSRPLQNIDLLTEIELKIAGLINAGLTINEISSNLCRSVDTIRTHSKSIYKKLGINKASQLTDHMAIMK